MNKNKGERITLKQQTLLVFALCLSQKLKILNTMRLSQIMGREPIVRGDVM